MKTALRKSIGVLSALIFAAFTQSAFAKDYMCSILVNSEHVLSAVKPGMTYQQAVEALGDTFKTPSYVDQRFSWKSANPSIATEYFFTVENGNVIAQLGDVAPTTDEEDAMSDNEKKFLALLNKAVDTNNYKLLPLTMAEKLLTRVKPAGFSYMYKFPDNPMEFIALIVDQNNKIVMSGSNCETPPELLPKDDDQSSSSSSS